MLGSRKSLSIASDLTSRNFGLCKKPKQLSLAPLIAGGNSPGQACSNESALGYEQFT
jgi:hypothetical protein